MSDSANDWPSTHVLYLTLISPKSPSALILNARCAHHVSGGSSLVDFGHQAALQPFSQQPTVDLTSGPRPQDWFTFHFYYRISSSSRPFFSTRLGSRHCELDESADWRRVHVPSTSGQAQALREPQSCMPLLFPGERCYLFRPVAGYLCVVPFKMGRVVPLLPPCSLPVHSLHLPSRYVRCSHPS